MSNSSGVDLLKVGADGGEGSSFIEGAGGGLASELFDDPAFLFVIRFSSFFTGFFFSLSNVLLAFSISSTANTSVIDGTIGEFAVSGLSPRLDFFFLSFLSFLPDSTVSLVGFLTGFG